MQRSSDICFYFSSTLISCSIMNLWLCSHFLVAGLFLSTSALTPECQTSVKPLSLDDPSMMFGRWNFLAAYTDSEALNTFLKVTESSWMSGTASTADAKEVVMSSTEKMNGTCVISFFNVTVDGVTASMILPNMTATFNVLPSCDDCLLIDVNTTMRNLDKILQKMNLNSDVTGEEMHVRGLYLYGRNTTLSDSDLEHYKQQATCLGFSGEPNFIYDPKNEFCAEGEGVKITF